MGIDIEDNVFDGFQSTMRNLLEFLHIRSIFEQFSKEFHSPRSQILRPMQELIAWSEQIIGGFDDFTDISFILFKKECYESQYTLNFILIFSFY